MRTVLIKLSFLLSMCLFLLMLGSCSNTKTMVVLLPTEDGSDGAVTVGEGDRSDVLDVPMTAAEVDNRGHIKKKTVTPDIVEENFSQALAAQPPEPISFILYFEEGNTELSPISKDTLSDLFEEVAKRQAVEVQVTGHTDRLDSEESNDRLSINRAQTIKDKLIEQGLKADFIRAVGRGERDLLIHTPDNTREPRNRRVEVIIR